MHKYWKKIIGSFLLLQCSFMVQADEPELNSSEVVAKMVQAHGGLEKWRSVRTMQFDTVMHNNYHGRNELAWWVATETIDKTTLHVHQNWFLNDAQIAFDGTDVWSVNWRKSNPPTAMLYFFYYFVNLPWLTQEENVILSPVTMFEWPESGGKQYYEVKMTFSEQPVIGKSPLDYFVLYIDPDSYLLAGYQYAIGNRAFLDSLGQPPERKLFGPLWRLITKYQTVDGLVFPAAFRTMPEANERIVGNHLIMNIDLNAKLTPEMLKRPANAIIDDPAKR
ncbi:MAG: hypothetical protein GJ680_05730 [Alteromonadaceae bacterium]|nr:hypothetical protein [Alteromonadaceae bacterium]